MARFEDGETSVVRLGQQAFAVHRDWGGLAGESLGVLSDVAVLRDRVYVLRRADPPILVLDIQGDVIATLGEGEVLDGHGIDADGMDGLLVADRDAHQVLRFAADGRRCEQWGERHVPCWHAPFNHPTAAARAPDGGLWVADGYGNARLHRFAADGALMLSIGELGEMPGQFRTPHDVAIAAGGCVLVCDRDNDRVQMVDAAGAVLSVWTGFVRPMAVAVDTQGWAWVTDQVPSLHRIALDGSSRTRARPRRQHASRPRPGCGRPRSTWSRWPRHLWSACDRCSHDVWRAAPGRGPMARGFGLAGGTYLVTGTNGVIGRAICLGARRAGCERGRSLPTDDDPPKRGPYTRRSASRWRTRWPRLLAQGVAAALVPAYLADDAAVGKLIETTELALGPRAGLVNKAGRLRAAGYASHR